MPEADVWAASGTARARASIPSATGWCFLLAVGLAPAIFGANVPLAWGLNAAMFGALLVVAGLGLVITGRPLPVPGSRLALPALAIGLCLLWALLQAVPWTPSALHHPAWERASKLLGEPIAGSISINPSRTWMALLRLATSAAVFFLAVQLARDAIWARRIVLAVATAGALWAVYALALRALGPDAAQILPAALFRPETNHELTGPFINRNHFAIYLGLGLLAAWGLFLRGLAAGGQEQGLSGRRALAARAFGVLNAAAKTLLLLAATLGGLLLTGSRAGFAFAGCALLVMLMIEHLRASRRASPVLIALVLAGIGAIFAVVMQGEELAAKIAGGDPSSDVHTRLGAAKITITALLDRPLLGSGYGTFRNAFPPFRDASVPMGLDWHEAHNTYLELMLELGVPAALLLLFSVGWLVVRCARGAITRKRDHMAAAVAVGATVLVGLHALVDFSIQLQGVQLTYAALLGAGYAQSWSSRQA